MLSETQRITFDALLEANYQWNQESDPDKKKDLYKEVSRLEQELKADMGEEAYDRFMYMGSQLFR